MAKSELDVATRALRLIAVADVSEDPSAEDALVATETYAALLEELSEDHGMAFEWAASATPDRLWLNLAGLVAERIAPIFGRAYDGRRDMARLRAQVFPDDRVEPVQVEHF
ncbi:hypothetical protein [Albimonas pacifica]|uniref:Uncharacterized protein n=1 Tax=Albimonas pacifica TaxID=1114924 RepID=A0A1I3LHS9_9RHOB|nr:hypothetical protein [Albimonas pacifica]SFI84304.1 hypothetical protein SAMN05216258_11036 [Albimonas pacifica]